MTTTIYTRDAEGKVTSQLLPLYRFMASAIGAMKRCEANAKASQNEATARNGESWANKWHSMLTQCERSLLPSGSGIDNGTKIDYDNSTDTKLVLTTSYHHMNDGGYYDGWTEHTIVVVPTFDGIDVIVKGRDRNDIKEYLGEVFHHNLTQLVCWTADNVSFPRENSPIAATHN